jgi:hypothetical protein
MNSASIPSLGLACEAETALVGSRQALCMICVYLSSLFLASSPEKAVMHKPLPVKSAILDQQLNPNKFTKTLAKE